MTVEGTDTSPNGNGQGQDPLQKRIDEGPKGGARTWYDVLEVAGDATAADIKKAYERAMALVEGRSIGGYLMLDPLAAESARADVEAAYAVLGDADKRKLYDEKLAASGNAPPSSSQAPEMPPPVSTPSKGTSVAAVAAVVEAKAGAVVDAKGAVDAKAGAVVDAKAAAADTIKPSPAQDAETLEAKAILGIETAPPRTSTPPLKILAPVGAEPPAPKFASKPPIKFEPVVTEAIEAPVNTIPPEAKMPAPMPPSSEAPVTLVPQAASPPGSTSGSTSGSPSASASGSTPGSAPGSTPATTIPPGQLPDEISGAVIKALREMRGVSLESLAEQTKIRKPYLKAIEEQDLPNLPARVYLRGFLTQVARVLKVDRNRLADGYIQFLDKL